MCAYAAANLRNIWFTGEEHTKLRLAVINGIQRKMKGGDFRKRRFLLLFFRAGTVASVQVFRPVQKLHNLFSV